MQLIVRDRAKKFYTRLRKRSIKNQNRGNSALHAYQYNQITQMGIKAI